MPTYNYTVTPVPYNGGTMTTTMYASLVMSETQLITMTQQTTPSMCLFSVVNFTSPMNSASNTQTVTTTALITNDTFYAKPQLVKYDTDKFMLLYALTSSNSTLRMSAVQINADNTLSIIASKTWTTSFYNPLSFFEANMCVTTTGASPVGLVTFRTGSNTTAQVDKFSLTGTSFSNYTAASVTLSNNGTSNITPPKLIAIPGTTRAIGICAYQTSNYTNQYSITVDASSNNINSAYWLSPAGISSTYDRVWLPYSASQMIELISPTSFRVWDFSPTTSWPATTPTTTVQFSSTTGGAAAALNGNYLPQGVVLDNKYFALAYANSTNKYIKIARVLNKDFAETSPNTNTGMGKLTTNWAGNELMRVNDNSFGSQIDYQTFRVFA